MKEYYTIQEFSNVSGVETSTLRYWDEIGLFSPVKRNPDNNYRHYAPEQLLALNFVTTLSELDIPLRTIAELRKERSPENLLNLLDKQEKKMDMELRTLRLRSSIIHARRELINYGVKIDETTIGVMFREDKELILWPRNKYQEGETFVAPLARFINKTAEQHINLSFPVGGYWDNMESFVKGPGLPDHFFSIDPLGAHMRKAGDYLIGFVRGYYGDMGDLPQKMLQYIKENKIDITGPVYTMYLHDEFCTHDPNYYLAQTCIAVAKPKRPLKLKKQRTAE